MAKHKRPADRFRIPAPSQGLHGHPNMLDNLTRLLKNYTQQQKYIGAPLAAPTFEQKLDITLQRYFELQCSYIQELTARGLNHSMEFVLNQDRIDVSFISDPRNPQAAPTQHHPTLKEAIKWFQALSPRDQFLAMMPCYNTGVVRINTQRWILFQTDILETDPYIRYQIHLTDYLTYDARDGEDGVSFTMDIQEQDTLQTSIYQLADVKGYIDRYTALTPSQLHWNKEQIHMWESINLQNAVDQNELYIKNDQANAATSLLVLFQRAMILTNYMLSKQRPVVERIRKSNANKTVHPSAQNKKPCPPPDKRIRRIGSVQFISKDMPRQTTKKTISHWHVDKWSVRGHTRTYANGKTVYIKPTVRHRKALQPSDSKPMQNILIFEESNIHGGKS